MSDEDKSEEEDEKGLLGKVSDKAKDTAKKGAKTVGDKTKEAAKKGAKKVGEKAGEVVKEQIEKGKESMEEVKKQSQRSAQQMDKQAQTWIGWFWSVIAYGFLIIISFAISSADSRFFLLPIVLLVGFPFFLYYAVINSIPELKIGNKVIFSRDNLSMKQQLSFTKKVAQTFSKEMIENSPLGAFLIFGFLILLLFVIIAPFLGL